MTKSIITTAISFSALHISALNMRAESHDDDISDILPSIRERGILTPLFVRDETPEGQTEKAFGIVAGRRRFNSLIALQIEAQEKAEAEGQDAPDYNPQVQCIIIDSNDDAAALEISLIENYARKDANEMEQYTTFYGLIKNGQTVEQIGATFGLTNKQVRQRLALGNLIPQIQDLYTRREISAENVQAFTLASKKKQREWLKLYKDDKAPRSSDLRHWLLDGSDIKTNVALFNIEDYKGKITTDLFGDNGIFADKAEFWKAQSYELGQRAEALTKDGWADVEIIEGRFHTWNHHVWSKEQGGKVYISVDQRTGEVEFHEGFLDFPTVNAMRKAEAKKQAQTDGDTNAEAPKIRPEMTANIVEYFGLHRHAIVRQELLKHPKIALRLTTAHMICGSGNFKVEQDSTRGNTQAQTSARNSTATQALNDERKAVLKLLKMNTKKTELFTDWNDKLELTALFRRLMALDDAQVLRVQAFAMSEALASYASITEGLGVMFGLDMGEHWTPDDEFFDLLKDKRVINKMLADIAGKPAAESRLTLTGKAQKEVLISYYKGTEARAAKDDWRPRWASFPAKPYVSAQTCHYTQQWADSKKDFKGLKA